MVLTDTKELAALDGANRVWTHPFAREEVQDPDGLAHEELGPIAATPEGGLWFATESQLTRIDAAGRALGSWRNPDWSAQWRAKRKGPVLVADREGFVYHTAGHGERRRIEARDTRGEKVFEVPGAFAPVAIDAWNRLLGVSNTELVAIG